MKLLVLCLILYSLINPGQFYEFGKEQNICEIDINRCGTVESSCVPKGLDDFKCVCHHGYKVDKDGDKETNRIPCTKTNMCETDPNRCGTVESSCFPKGLDDFICVCNVGYKVDKDGAEETNRIPCTRQNMCETGINRCGTEESICSPIALDDFKCVCNMGYKVAKEGYKENNKIPCTTKTCIDNPCGVGNSVCMDNDDGLYNCKCNDGYWQEEEQQEGANLKPCVAKTCKDNPCGVGNSVCEDIVDGLYNCKCYDGFKPVKGQIEEANLNPCIAIRCYENPCGTDTSTTECMDTEEGYVCRCKDYFKTDYGQTVDTNLKACIAKTCEDNPCGIYDSICEEKVEGGYNCKCKDGFKVQKGQIEGANRKHCIAKTCADGPCGVDNSVCEDKYDGRYNCKCNAGFKLRAGETEGENLNPCIAITCYDEPCGIGSDCESKDGGSYNCKCKDGFKLEEGQIEGANLKPCIEARDPCDPNPCENGGKCISSQYGTIQCECLTGTSGGMCEVVDDCASARLSCTAESNATCGFNVEKREAACRCQDPKLEYDEDAGICGAPCPLECEHGLCRKDPEGILKCYCSADYTGPLCQYKDACGSRRYELCNNRGECLTTGNNQFKCNCYYGYSGPRCTIRTTPVEQPSTPKFSTRRPVYQSTTPYPWYFTTNGYFRSTRDYRTTRSNENSDPYPWYFTTNGYFRSTRDYRTTRFKENSDATRNRVWTDFTTSTDFTPVLVDHCTYDKDCLNGGMCRFESRRGNVCLCRKPYIGDNCELNDVCESLKPTCEAIGAICTYIKWLGKGICECPPNKTHNMELHMCEDICHPEMCALGKCEVVNSRPICRCFPGYEGHKCDRKIPKDNLRYIVLFAGILVAVVFAFVVTSTIVAIFLKRLRKVEKTELK